jgi:hypothetical protein
MSDKSETYYGMGGNAVENETKALAKVVLIKEREYYFVWFWRGDLYDPYGPDILRKSQQFMSKFTKVNKATFEDYYRYLKTKNRLYLNRAKRNSLRS